MRVSSISVAMPVYRPVQEKYKNQYQSELVSNPNYASSIKTSCYYPTFTSQNNTHINKILNKMVKEAFDSKDTRKLLNFVNESVLKPIFPSRMNKSKLMLHAYIKDPSNKNFPVDSAILGSKKLYITADKTGHIQVTHNGRKLFVEVPELAKYMDKDGLAIIPNGLRGFDPCNQPDWKLAPIGREWTPDETTRAASGVAKLKFDKSGKGVFLNTPETVGQGYMTSPRALAMVDGNSVIFSFEQKNYNPKVDFGAWSILPFKITNGKKTLAIFPIEERTAKRYMNSVGADIEEMKKSEQWSIDKNNRFLTIDASKPSPKSEYIDPDADWCLIANEGEDTAYLLRSCYKDNSVEKQFKIYSEREAGGGKEYFEAEFMSPRVKNGETSTLLYRLDVVNLKDLGIKENLTKENMNEVLQKAANLVEKRVDVLRKDFRNNYLQYQYKVPSIHAVTNYNQSKKD